MLSAWLAFSPSHALLVVVVPAGIGEGRRGDDQAVDQLAVGEREAQSNGAAHRVADDIDRVVAERADDLGDVGRHVVKTHRPVERAGMAVPLGFDGDHSRGPRRAAG